MKVRYPLFFGEGYCSLLSIVLACKIAYGLVLFWERVWTSSILKGCGHGLVPFYKGRGGRGRGHVLILQRETLSGSILQLITFVS